MKKLLLLTAFVAAVTAPVVQAAGAARRGFLLGVGATGAAVASGYGLRELIANFKVAEERVAKEKMQYERDIYVFRECVEELARTESDLKHGIYLLWGNTRDWAEEKRQKLDKKREDQRRALVESIFTRNLRSDEALEAMAEVEKINNDRTYRH